MVVVVFGPSSRMLSLSPAMFILAGVMTAITNRSELIHNSFIHVKFHLSISCSKNVNHGIRVDLTLWEICSNPKKA